MRGFGSFIAVVTLIVTVLALGRDYYEITYEPDDGIHADFGKQPDDDEHSRVEPAPQPKLGVVKPRRTRDAVPKETETEEPEIIPSPSETTAEPSEPPTSPPPTETPTPTITETTWEPGGGPATPAP
ncbi:hypothetical protein ACFY36_42730 [Actinoplanes sp. NPDC000266]